MTNEGKQSPSTTEGLAEPAPNNQEKSKFLTVKNILICLLIGLVIQQLANKFRQFRNETASSEVASVDPQSNSSDEDGLLLPEHKNESLSSSSGKKANERVSIKSPDKELCEKEPPVNGKISVYSKNIPPSNNSYMTFVNTTGLHGYVWIYHENVKISSFYIAPNQKASFKAPSVRLKYTATLMENWCSHGSVNDPSSYLMARTTSSLFPYEYGPNTNATVHLSMQKFMVESSAKVDAIEAQSE